MVRVNGFAMSDVAYAIVLGTAFGVGACLLIWVVRQIILGRSYA